MRNYTGSLQMSHQQKTTNARCAQQRSLCHKAGCGPFLLSGHVALINKSNYIF
jgi:hypothetical protein